MKSKNLALINGIVGLVGGIFLLIAVFLFVGGVASDTVNTLQGLSQNRSSITTSSTSFITTLSFVVKLMILVLGIIGAVYYKGDARIGSAPHVLLIVGGAVSIIPFLGWAGAIVSIIGGAIYLSSLKKFNISDN
jgi:hypothetical protein